MGIAALVQPSSTRLRARILTRAPRFPRSRRRRRELAENDGIWKRLYAKRFGLMPSGSPAPDGNWKALYKFQTRVVREVLLNKSLDEILERAYPRWPSCGTIQLPMTRVRHS